MAEQQQKINDPTPKPPLAAESSTGEHLASPGQRTQAQTPDEKARTKNLSVGARIPGISGYEILSELGRGGMGVVYKARQSSLNRVVALKMVLSGEYVAEAQLARFQIEAEAVARLKHPNIVQLHEFGAHDGLPYFTLEFMEGGSLATKIKDKPLSPREAAMIVEQLARGMAAAHAQGIIHRDLKPENVLLATDGAPKIADFGLAKQLEDEASPNPERGNLTNTGAIMGTPSYMSPEQARGDKLIGPATDVWALGAILYRLITGRPPFLGTNSFDTIVQVIESEPAQPRTLTPGLPRDLETICLKCLRKESAKRYVSANELAEDLRFLLDGKPIAARPVGRAERGIKWTKRNPVVAALLLAIVLVTIMGTAGILVKYQDAKEQAGRADREAKAANENAGRADRAATKAQDNANWADREAVTAKKQTQIAQDEERSSRLSLYVSRMNAMQMAWQTGNSSQMLELLNATRPGPGKEDLRGFEWYYWHRICTATNRILATNQQKFYANRSRSVAITSNGALAATVEDQRTVKIWDIKTGSVIQTIQPDLRSVHSITFSPDDKRLVVAGDLTNLEGNLTVWDVSTGKRQLTINTLAERVIFTKDGAALVASCWDGCVRIWDSKNGNETHQIPVIVDRGLLQFNVAISPDGQTLAVSNLSTAVGIWDLQSQTKLFAIPIGINRFVPGGLAFSPSGDRLALSKIGGDVEVWDVASQKQVLTLAGHSDFVGAIRYSADGKRIITASDDTTLRVWSADFGRTIQVLRGHLSAAQDVGVNTDFTLAASCDNNTIRIWNLTRLQEHTEISRGFGSASSFSPDSTLLASCSYQVCVWDSRTEKMRCLRSQNDDNWSWIRFLPRGDQFMTVSFLKGKVAFWDSVTLREIRRFDVPSSFHPAISPDGKWLAGAPVDHISVRLVETGQEIQSLRPVRKGEGSQVAFSPDGKTLLAYHSSSMEIWNTQTWQPKSEWKLPNEEVRAIAFHPKDSTLGVYLRDGRLKVWDLSKGFYVLDLIGAGGVSNYVSRLAFSPDGSRLAASCSDRQIRIWDLRTGSVVLTLKGPTTGSTSFEFSPNGQHLVVGGIQTLVWTSTLPHLADQ